MNVLVIGSGGREHALAYAISKSRSLKKLFISPGNPGTASLGENILLDLNRKSIADFCNSNNIELVVIGPEQFLVNGLADQLRDEGIDVFGPNACAADIEGHKTLAKKLMLENNIPTAEFAEFTIEHPDDAYNYIKEYKYPLVIKADGLAAGKGVIICNDYSEAVNALNEIFVHKIFGISGEKIIIEEFMLGQEASLFVVTDGENYFILPSAQDYKRIGDIDIGKNTGGMGSFAPSPLITLSISKLIEKNIIIPTLKAMKDMGRNFSGCLYIGLMITNEGPKVVEYNCRFGDPETQVVLPLLQGDFLKLLYSAAIGIIDKNAVSYNGGSALCVVLSSDGYPDKYKTGFEITGLNYSDPAILIYHAGTKMEEDKIFTAGGRVLGVTAVNRINNIEWAKRKAYTAVQNIYFNGMYCRSDIGDKGINQQTVYHSE